MGAVNLHHCEALAGRLSTRSARSVAALLLCQAGAGMQEAFPARRLLLHSTAWLSLTILASAVVRSTTI